MEAMFECIVVGGPQHGLVYQRPWHTGHPTPLAVITDDGGLCRPAARKHGDARCTRLILLHPQATGEQFLTMLVHEAAAARQFGRAQLTALCRGGD